VGLTDVLASLAVRGAHVLVVEVPGAWPLRAAMERAVLERGWRLASAPAGADVLAVCGRPGPQLAEAVEKVWEQLPGPRVRIGAETEREAVPALERAALELSDTPRHQQDARRRLASGATGAAHRQMDMGAGHMQMDMGHMGTGQGMAMDMGMDMAPEGIPLARGAADRDGLEMDVLHLRYGPVLRYWPAGLVLRCTLQGDVITRARIEMLDEHDAGERIADATRAEPPLLESARLCDHITTVVALAGWQDAASRCRRIRDSLLTAQDVDSTAAALGSLTRRIGRSRLLRWALRNIGVLTVEEARALRLSSAQAGDTWDRLLVLLDRARGELSTSPSGVADTSAPMDTVAAVPRLVEGLDLATARLAVASLGLDPFPRRQETSHD
jgi:hypothetical protein